MELNDILIGAEVIEAHRKLYRSSEKEMQYRTLSDYGLIGKLYSFFCNKLNEIHPGIDVREVQNRRKFLFIVLALYSPKTFAGVRMKMGLRNKLAQVLGCSEADITYYCRNLTFHYRLYPGFRSDIDKVYEELKKSFEQE